jgi:hypothetical protein
VGDGFEGLPEVVGQRIGGRNRLPSGLDLNGTVSAGCLDEFSDGPPGLRFDPPADGERGEPWRLTLVVLGCPRLLVLSGVAW